MWRRRSPRLSTIDGEGECCGVLGEIMRSLIETLVEDLSRLVSGRGPLVVDPEQDLLSLGLDSLGLVQLIGRAEALGDVELSSDDILRIFRRPRLSEIAVLLRNTTQK